MLLQVGWRNHNHNVEKDVWVFLEKQVDLLLDYLLEFLSVAIRDAVPLLWLSIVTIINRGEHEVFVMPAECRILHADVEPGDVDA